MGKLSSKSSLGTSMKSVASCIDGSTRTERYLGLVPTGAKLFVAVDCDPIFFLELHFLFFIGAYFVVGSCSSSSIKLISCPSISANVILDTVQSDLPVVPTVDVHCASRCALRIIMAEIDPGFDRRRAHSSTYSTPFTPYMNIIH